MTLLVAGVALGCVYALIASGFSLIYRGTAILNFAQGGFVVLGGYVAYTLASSASLPFALAVPLAVVVMAGFGWALQQAIFVRLAGRPLFTLFLLTLMIDSLLLTGMNTYKPWAESPKEIGTPWGHELTVIAGASVPTASLWVIAISIVVLAALAWWLSRSWLGLAMEVNASDHELAGILGMRVRRVSAVAWAAGGGLAALAGTFLAVFPQLLDPTSSAIGLRAIPAVILGGISSGAGAVAGGLIIGLVEVYTAAYAPDFLGTNLHLVVPYALMLVILLVRPQGLFGAAEVHRA
jgi:branched-chain amino acid transport system permease protein